ncbi:antibiotic biosynthesis monooxygenase [Vibrio sp. TH_r3]|uniref:putative quinol monooxygenase n=1 Tax=Vibrio sp. TH_r3 TaxID=3082084 RepID=UPI002955033C|nr:antibiotic biosynthesis monooxygenase [Vibrio sp. TH_r3]MDV7104578.1 antibiotic biosynthesis monooxygenase [Vibrio sp. TH_r3]
MNQTIFVTAELKMNSGKPREQVVQAIEQFCLDMQSETGCLQAIATYDEKEPQRVILWERYKDRTAIEAHFTMSHTELFIATEMAELVQTFETQAQQEAKS